MKQKQLFIKALNTLFFSGGGDPQPETYWGCNELLDWYEKEYGVTLGVRFDEESPDGPHAFGYDGFDEVIEKIKNS
jgi:hypothetical protein